MSLKDGRLMNRIEFKDVIHLVYSVLLCLVLTVGCGKQPSEEDQTTATGDIKSQLQVAVDSRDWQAADSLAKQAIISHPNDPGVLTNTAIVTANQGDRVSAAFLLVDAVKAADYSTDGGRVDNAIRALVDVGRVYDAIELLESVLQNDAKAAGYRRMLVGFLGEVQLTQELPEHVSRLIMDRQFDLHLLMATTELNARRYSTSTAEVLLSKNPNDLRPLLATAYHALGQRDASAAEKTLHGIIDRHPDFMPAHGLLARALVAQGKYEALTEWSKSVPSRAEGDAGYWIGLGALANEAGDVAGAVRAFAEASRLAPNDVIAWSHLGKAIRRWEATSSDTNTAAKTPDLLSVAAAVDQRANDLIELRDCFTDFVIEGNQTQSSAVEIARQLLELGRFWEAEAWLAVATTITQGPADELKSMRQLAIRGLTADRQWQSQRDRAEFSFELEPFPIPADFGESSSIVAERSSSDVQKFPIVLADEARDRSLRFLGTVGKEVVGPKVPISQTLGCGGGAIDLDLDGRHDLVFTAAGGAIRERDNEPGALFRNLGDTFQDVSVASGFADQGFGHGVAVGDYNDDGFQDILVLNFGVNHLFRNCGDGTFQDITTAVGIADSKDWSSSGAICDVDQDGFNDLVIVNYCDAGQPVDLPCFDTAGNEINCYPKRFAAASDQFLRGTADGTFVDVSDEWSAATSMNGRGLGVVAGRLDGLNQCLYVANDASVNHFYRKLPDSSPTQLTEAAVASGLAVDAHSLDQGSMGIAASDFDNDGDLDFYVTGFADEYNIVYEQRAPGIWADRTGVKKLVEGTLETVGFGTQPLDLDCDGIDELIVANGHVGDFGARAPAYAQKLQVFRSTENGGYMSVDIDQWGEYFSSPHVGRALFTCDVDSDGRLDAVVTHSLDEVALLVNHSPSPHRFLSIRLIDTVGSRDAIGAVVDFDVITSKEKKTRRLFRLAGSGYLSSNQSELYAGIGPAESIHDLRITWPDGQIQMVGDLETNAEYVIARNGNAFACREFGAVKGEQ